LNHAHRIVFARCTYDMPACVHRIDDSTRSRDTCVASLHDPPRHRLHPFNGTSLSLLYEDDMRHTVRWSNFDRWDAK
jgi:hypothetical protein